MQGTAVWVCYVFSCTSQPSPSPPRCMYCTTRGTLGRMRPVLTFSVRFLYVDRGRGAAQLQGKLRPLEADTLQAATLGRQPATAREAFQMQQDGLTGGSSGGLTGRWRKVKVRR